MALPELSRSDVFPFSGAVRETEKGVWHNILAAKRHPGEPQFLFSIRNDARRHWALNSKGNPTTKLISQEDFHHVTGFILTSKLGATFETPIILKHKHEPESTLEFTEAFYPTRDPSLVISIRRAKIIEEGDQSHSDRETYSKWYAVYTDDQEEPKPTGFSLRRLVRAR